MKPILFKKKNKTSEIINIDWVNSNNSLPYVISLTQKIINVYFNSLGYNYIKDYIYNSIDENFTCIYQLTLKDINEIINNFEKFKTFSDLFEIISFEIDSNDTRKEYFIIELVTKIKNISKEKIKNIEILFKLYST